jgi:hypothetical protein
MCGGISGSEVEEGRKWEARDWSRDLGEDIVLGVRRAGESWPVG